MRQSNEKKHIQTRWIMNKLKFEDKKKLHRFANLTKIISKIVRDSKICWDTTDALNGKNAIKDSHQNRMKIKISLLLQNMFLPCGKNTKSVKLQKILRVTFVAFLKKELFYKPPKSDEK